MKTTAILSLFLIFLNSCTTSENIFEKTTIKGLADRVRNYRNKQLNDPPPYNWVTGTYYTGLVAMYETTSDEEYLNQCLKWGKSCHWEIPDKTEQEWGSEFYSLVCGQIWYACYQAVHDESMLSPTFGYLENPNRLNPISAPSEWYLENCGLRFVDGLFTSPPLFAMLYQLTGEEKYVRWMDACFWDTSEPLYDEEEGLFYRDVTYRKGYHNNFKDGSDPASGRIKGSHEKQTSRNGKKVFWSRGNGWVFGGLVRILTYLPKDHSSYERYKALYVQMASTLKACQQADGFWRPNLADPLDYDMNESSGTAFFTYGIAWGINNGILPGENYLPIVRKGWSSLVSVVDDKGEVQWGQRPGTEPASVVQEDSTTYGSGLFLLAASEVYKLEIE
ncbi:MAG: hypothetical protein HOI15_11615 [Opitutales bacterium]|jgi:unsaturated rhamnogalacturonyl hydrolase|nr:hypothetical protein [Opitutales bacterium]MBT5814974.1 hypothetical protein [Opitutales bacterium]